MTHYIYAFIDPRDNIFRYIGQGTGRRCNWWRYVKNNDEEQYGVRPWVRRLKALGREPIVMIVAKNLTKAEANEYEIALIDLIGRSYQNTGPLLNRSAGGESGAYGCKQSEATRRRTGEAVKTAHARPEVKQRHSEAIRAAHARPGMKQRYSEAIMKALARPESKYRRSEASRTALAKPKTRERLSEALKLACARSEVKRRKSEAAKAFRANAEHQRNVRHRAMCKGRTYKGTVKEGDRWGASLKNQGKRHRRHGFCTEADAAEAYNNLVDEFQGGDGYKNPRFVVEGSFNNLWATAGIFSPAT